MWKSYGFPTKTIYGARFHRKHNDTLFATRYAILQEAVSSSRGVGLFWKTEDDCLAAE